MSKAVKIQIHKMVVKPAAVFGSETQPVTKVDMNRRVHGRGNIKKGTWIGGTARNMESKN
jgi:hypothetical protein